MGNNCEDKDAANLHIYQTSNIPALLQPPSTLSPRHATDDHPERQSGDTPSISLTSLPRLLAETATEAMRFSAIVPILLLTAALILTYLGLFAGHKKSFLQDYEVLNLNISQIGSQSVRTLSNSRSDVSSDLSQAVSNLSPDAQSLVQQSANSVVQALGLPQFYNVHVLTYCEGDYQDHQKSYTNCSQPQTGYTLDPRNDMQSALDAAGLSDTDTETLKETQQLITSLTRAAAALFIADIIIISINLFSAVISSFAAGRVSACCNVLFNFLAFLISAVISALMTAVVSVGRRMINQWGEDYGIVASGGRKFLGLTWAATGCLFVTAVAWCVDCGLVRRRNQREPVVVEKYHEGAGSEHGSGSE
ncbi:hypothetical protein BST61_g142 [Cercospora zeina]